MFSFYVLYVLIVWQSTVQSTRIPYYTASRDGVIILPVLPRRTDSLPGRFIAGRSAVDYLFGKYLYNEPSYSF